MTDVVSQEKRSQMMAGIKGKNTKPEKLIRSLLHKHRFRFRLHGKYLPGKPDLVFRKYKAVIFVNGCFWHGHPCSLFKTPSSNKQFWIQKINQNKERDLRVVKSLSQLGWKVLVIHECAFRGPGRRDMNAILDLCTQWLVNGLKNSDISGL